MNKQRVARELVTAAKEMTAGTWSLPRSPLHVKLLELMYKNMKGGEEPTVKKPDPHDAMYSILGDDSLFNDFDSAKRKYYKECAKAMKKRIGEFAKQDEEDFGEPKEYQSIVELAKKI